MNIDGTMYTVRGTISTISADNPASCALGGFKEGSTAYRFCRHCLITIDQLRETVHSSQGWEGKGGGLKPALHFENCSLEFPNKGHFVTSHFVQRGLRLSSSQSTMGKGKESCTQRLSLSRRSFIGDFIICRLLKTSVSYVPMTYMISIVRKQQEIHQNQKNMA